FLAMEKSSFVRYDPSVHEVMQHLLSELTVRSNRGQLVLTNLRSELQHDLYIPRYEILRPSSVFNSMADHLKNLGFVAGSVEHMFVRDKKVQLPRKLSYKLGRSLFKKVGDGKDQCASSCMENVQKKNDDDFVAVEHLNEYSSVAETRRTKLQSEVGSASMSRSKNNRKRFTPRKRCLKGVVHANR
nr:zeaxanthin epoxidase [Tanacetum cinerariifolium]